MSELKDSPLQVLDRLQTLQLVASGSLPNGLDKYRIKSTWLCDELNRKEAAEGFQYNAQFQRYIEEAEGIGPFGENGTTLSVLIYNAQGYRRSDSLKAEGFSYLTADLIDKAIQQGAKVEVKSDGIFGSSRTVCRPMVAHDGRRVAMLPRKRTRGFIAGSSQVVARIVKG